MKTTQNIRPTDFPVPAIPLDLNVPGVDLKLWVAEDAFALLDDPKYLQQFDEMDGLIPYWAELWPAARFLCRYVLEKFSDGPKLRVLEIGAGLGSVGMTLASMGHEVTMTDFAPDALDILRIHVRENGLDAKVEKLDFFADDVLAEAPYNLIVGADILFEDRFCQPVLDTAVRHMKKGGLCLISDPNRQTAEPFVSLEPQGDFELETRVFSIEECKALSLQDIRCKMRLFIIKA